MRIFIFEYTCATTDPRAAALRNEGQAMLDAAVQDFGAIAGVSVETLGAYQHKSELAQAFRRAARDADYTLVIAPECDEILYTYCRAVEEVGGKLLGPDAAAVRLTSDKLALSRHWLERGIPTPQTQSAADADELPFPLVCKPRYGAGSQDTVLISDRAAWRAWFAGRGTHDFVAQPFVPGRSASVAFLIGPHEARALCPASQELSNDGRFHYLGGDLPLPDDLATRAVRLGRRCVESVPGLKGYVGVDLILGPAADGSEDHAIEINPRLTTSYIGLRALAKINLADALLRVAAGEPCPAIAWHADSVRFSASGEFFRFWRAGDESPPWQHLNRA